MCIRDFAVAQHRHNAQASLNTAAKMLTMNLRMIKLYFFVERNKKKLQSLFDEIRKMLESLLKKSMESMKDAYHRLPKSKPLIPHDKNFINSQFELMENFIKTIKGALSLRTKFLLVYLKLYKANDKKLMVIIKERIQERHPHVVALVPFLTMALTERIGVCIFNKRCPPVKIDKFVRQTAAKLRNIAEHGKLMNNKPSLKENI